MKKKLLLLSILATSFLGMAKFGAETQLKFGYDFYRTLEDVKKPTKSLLGTDEKLNRGINLNLEIIPINLANRVEFGLGVGYTGGLFNLFPTVEKANTKSDFLYSVPIYFLTKFNLVNLSNKDSILYTDLRVGYTATGSRSSAYSLSQGFGFGVSLGTEYKNFVAGLAYDGTLTKVTPTSGTPATWGVFHRIGLQLGVRFGSESTSKPAIVEIEKPKVAPKPVVVVKPEVVKPVEVKPVEVVKTIVVEKPVIKEVVKEVPVVKEVVKEVPVVKEVEVVKEVIKEVPVVKEVVKPVEVVKEVVKPVTVVTPKPKGTVIKNVAGGVDTGLELGQYTKSNLPDIIFVKEDGYVYTNGNRVYGANGRTEAKNVFIEKDGDLVFLNGAPLVLRVFKTDGEDFKLVTDNKGTKLVSKKAPKPEKIVFFPNRCFENKCVINGFVSNANQTNAQELEQLQYFVNTVNNYAKSAKLEIVGHTDSQGRAAYNKSLGLRRARGIKNILENNGLKKSLTIIDTNSKGEESPYTTNATAEGRYKNRRVEIIFHDMVK